MSWKSKEEHFGKHGGEWKAPDDRHFRKATHAHPSVEGGREKGRPTKPEAVTSPEGDQVSGPHFIEAGASDQELKRRDERHSTVDCMFPLNVYK